MPGKTKKRTTKRTEDLNYDLPSFKTREVLHAMVHVDNIDPMKARISAFQLNRFQLLGKENTRYRITPLYKEGTPGNLKVTRKIL